MENRPRFDRTRYYLGELYYLPRIFFAWIFMHIATWFGMTTFPTEEIETEDLDNLFEELIKDLDIEELDNDNDKLN